MTKRALRRTIAIFLINTMFVLLSAAIVKNNGIVLFLIPIIIDYILLASIETSHEKAEKELALSEGLFEYSARFIDL